jgi:hypothetical protein
MDKKILSFRIFAVIGFSILSLVTAPILTVAEASSVVAVTDNVQPFAGTWTALLDGTRIVELVLRVERGNLTGTIRVCGFSIDTEGTGKLGLVTNEKMSPGLALRNVKLWGKSVSFDWTDPDGDENHWKLELIRTDAGRLILVGLPSGLKAEPIPVSRTSN